MFFSKAEGMSPGLIMNDICVGPTSGWVSRCLSIALINKIDSTSHLPWDWPSVVRHREWSGSGSWCLHKASQVTEITLKWLESEAYGDRWFYFLPFVSMKQILAHSIWMQVSSLWHDPRRYWKSVRKEKRRKPAKRAAKSCGQLRTHLPWLLGAHAEWTSDLHPDRFVCFSRTCTGESPVLSWTNSICYTSRQMGLALFLLRLRGYIMNHLDSFSNTTR